MELPIAMMDAPSNSDKDDVVTVCVGRRTVAVFTDADQRKLGARQQFDSELSSGGSSTASTEVVLAGR